MVRIKILRSNFWSAQELLRRRREKFFVARRIGDAQVVDGFNQADTEIVRPNTVNNGACEIGIIARDQPIGQMLHGDLPANPMGTCDLPSNGVGVCGLPVKG